MPRLIWTRGALADLQRLYRYLLQRDVDAAQRAVKAIRIGVKILTHQPRIGSPMKDMEADFREWTIDFGNSGYVVLYRFDGSSVYLLAVRHQREAGY